MSQEYSEYIVQHKDNVKKGFEWLKRYLPDIFDEDLLTDVEVNILSHDYSKMNADEYDAYDDYFYGKLYGKSRSFEVVEQFNRAWLLHIHRNPHHWQYWILRNDNPDEGEILIDMPDCYIIEMICDWWSFSWKQENLYEIFKWYEERKDYIKLSDYTRKKVEDILNKMHIILDDDKLTEAGNPAVNLMDPYNRKVMGILNDATE